MGVLATLSKIARYRLEKVHSCKHSQSGKAATMTGIGRLIGNAVPVRLGRVVARSLVKHFQIANDVLRESQ
jgi:hypothetical protein